jgi:PilZ domain
MCAESQEPVEARTPSPSERRRELRVDVLGQIDAHSVWKLRPLSLREISLTGFSVESTSSFEVDTVNKFRLNLDGLNRSVVVQARTRHCTLMSTSGDLPIYVAGFEFIAPTESTLRELVALVEYAKSLWQG